MTTRNGRCPEQAATSPATASSTATSHRNPALWRNVLGPVLQPSPPACPCARARGQARPAGKTPEARRRTCAPASAPPDPVADLPTGGQVDGLWDVLEHLHPACAAAGPHRHVTHADRGHAGGGEPVEPGVVARAHSGRSGSGRHRAARALTYSAGSATSRCQTQASHPVPASQPSTRSGPALPGRDLQLASSCAEPSGASTRAARVTSARAQCVAGQAAVAVVVPPSAQPSDTTNGGLATIRSNCSPAGTGSSSDPARRSHCCPHSAAVVAANRSARALMSVAVTRLGVRGQVQGLHAAAGAEVERAGNGRARGQTGPASATAAPMPST